MRKDPLVTGQIYHVISRSIADFKVFNNIKEYNRAKELINYFRLKQPPTKFSYFLKQKEIKKFGFQKYFNQIAKNQEKRVEIIAYCLMPTHIHLLLKQLDDFGVSTFMKNILISYSRYFNTKHKRKGPLWESRFKSILVNKDDYLLHLTRYIHLNPATTRLVNKPEKWQFSSYLEYINESDDGLTNRKDLLEINSLDYQKFVEDRRDYQRRLAQIKNLMLEPIL
jgi:putative transposase